MYFFSSQYDKALAHFEEALQIPAGVHAIPREVAAGLNSLGVAYGSLGEYDKALGYFAKVAKSVSSSTTPRTLPRLLNNMATVYVFQQRYQTPNGLVSKPTKSSKRPACLACQGGAGRSLSGDASV